MRLKVKPLITWVPLPTWSVVDTSIEGCELMLHLIKMIQNISYLNTKYSDRNKEMLFWLNVCSYINTMEPSDFNQTVLVNNAYETQCTCPHLNFPTQIFLVWPLSQFRCSPLWTVACRPSHLQNPATIQRRKKKSDFICYSTGR